MATKFDTLLDDMFDTSLDKTKSEYHSDIETFDTYKTRKKEEYKHEFNDFVDSLVHGYEVIINKLENRF